MMDEADPITRACIAGLKHELDEANAVLRQAQDEVARLRDDCDYWKGQTLTKDQRIDDAKAEIARLRDMERRFTAVLNTNERVKRDLLTANAEITRLTKLLEWARMCVPYPSDCHTAIVAALKTNLKNGLPPSIRGTR